MWYVAARASAEPASPSLVSALKWYCPVLLLFCSACSCWYTAGREDVAVVNVVATPLTELHVIPSSVYVPPGAVFTMRVRMLDDDGGFVPEHALLRWTPGPGLVQMQAQGDSIVLAAGDVPPGASLATTLEARVDARDATATVIIIAPNAAGSPDTVVAEYRSASSPDVLLIDGKTAGGTANDSLIAFVGTALIGSFTGTPAEIVRFSTDRRFDVLSVSWSAGSDKVDLGPSLPGPLQPVIAVSDATAPGAATEIALDAGYAQSIFRRERTGVDLTFGTTAAAAFGVVVLEIAADNSCLDMPGQLAELGVPAAILGPARLSVIYVDEILEQAAGPDVEPVSAGVRGYACPDDPTLGTVLLVSRALRSGPTLGHELGHALGLVEPFGGHITLLGGFSYTNMMWAGDIDSKAAARSAFSLGQAFRVNADKHSWLFIAGLPTWLPRSCSGDLSVDVPCPPVSRDFFRQDP